MNMAMWDANKRVKSFCARLKQQVNQVSVVELGTAMKIYQTYFVTMRISTLHIKNMINWNALTWCHICIPMNQDMSCKDVLIVTIFIHYCSQFVYLSKSQNGTLLLHNDSQSYIPPQRLWLLKYCTILYHIALSSVTNTGRTTIYSCEKWQLWK